MLPNISQERKKTRHVLGKKGSILPERGLNTTTVSIGSDGDSGFDRAGERLTSSLESVLAEVK